MTTRNRSAAKRWTAPTDVAGPQEAPAQMAGLWTAPGEAKAPREVSTATGARPMGPLTRLRTEDAGMATAEYAVATLAAVGFAGLLFAVLRSGEVQELLLELVRRALSTI